MADKIDRSKEPALGKKLTLDDGVASDVRIVNRSEKMAEKIGRKESAPKPKVAASKKPPSSKVGEKKTAKGKVNAKNKNQSIEPSTAELSESAITRVKISENKIGSSAEAAAADAFIEELKNATQVFELEVSSMHTRLEGSMRGSMRRQEESDEAMEKQSEEFRSLVEKFQIEKIALQKTSTIICVSSVSALAVAIFFSILATLTFSSKNEFFNSVSNGLSNRIVTMNEGLVSFNLARDQLSILQNQVEGLELKLDESQLGYINTEEDIQGQLLTYTQDINTEFADQTANLRANLTRLDERFSAFNTRMLDFGDILDQSEIKLAEMSSEAKGLNELKAVLDALLTLEKERYFEVTEAATNESGLGQESSLPKTAGPTLNRYYSQ
jgi:hypothetical protein